MATSATIDTKWLTTEEVVDKLGGYVPRRTVVYWIAHGRFSRFGPVRRLGERKWQVSEQAVEAFLAAALQQSGEVAA